MIAGPPEGGGQVRAGAGAAGSETSVLCRCCRCCASTAVSWDALSCCMLPPYVRVHAHMLASGINMVLLFMRGFLVNFAPRSHSCFLVERGSRGVGDACVTACGVVSAGVAYVTDESDNQPQQICVAFASTPEWGQGHRGRTRPKGSTSDFVRSLARQNCMSSSCMSSSPCARLAFVCPAMLNVCVCPCASMCVCRDQSVADLALFPRLVHVRGLHSRVSCPPGF